MHKRPDGDSNYRRRTSRPQPGRPVPKNLGARGPRDYTPAEPEDDFRPPNPKNPVAGAKPGVVIGAVLMILGIIALILYPFLGGFLPSTFQSGWTVAALVAIAIFGLVVLFMQMPAKRSGGDDGARL
ncbi:hypothetical protein [Nesterenkonia alkaliphila]|uniref:Uncharacterized protein n=1 Tax=Nesterenkonia alkaliphila TaxID=1463631 RepID=A0A7K1UG42_9MICC|nr:hypothetical protein [Nesterenkonia alkaliphila]MVT25433.1 hypothetical protein [Nesterenkonia alkaliphila]GFZ83968.1 hypothetical protein GCM10011359_10860 [Nesterenkonia alkaliphila]